MRVLGAAALVPSCRGDYARIGQITGVIHAIGVVAILIAPVTSETDLAD